MKVVQAEASSLCTGMKFEDKDGIDRPVRMIKPGAWAAALGRGGGRVSELLLVTSIVSTSDRTWRTRQ